MLLKAKEKKERALGVKLMLKAERCASPKCATVRRPYRPGLHGQARHNVSEYGRELREKQKIQITYGLNNRQMKNLFKKKLQEKIILALEQRLDRVVSLLGLARSPRIARQLISHGHIFVNGRKVTIPSYYVRIGNIVSINPNSRALKIFEELPIKSKSFNSPAWFKVNPEELKGECVAFPKLEEIHLPFNINLVAQFYSK